MLQGGELGINRQLTGLGVQRHPTTPALVIITLGSLSFPFPLTLGLVVLLDPMEFTEQVQGLRESFISDHPGVGNQVSPY